MKFNKSERIKQLKSENEELKVLKEKYRESNDSLYNKIQQYESLFKRYNLSKFFTLNNEFIGRIVVEYERREFCYDFCKYEIDNDFLIVFAKENIYYFKKEKVDNFLIKYYKEGEQSDEVGKEKTII